MTDPVPDEWRAWLAPLADLLIPEADGMPAASEVGVSAGQLDLVLAVRPDLGRHLGRAVALTEGLDPRRALATLPELDPAAHAALQEVVAGGYYAHPEVRRRLEYTGQQPVPVRPENYPKYVAEGLLERVVQRGEVYRPAD
jgi:hypothetical protein